MRTASTWRGVRIFAPAILLGTVTGLALQGCMSVEVRVDPVRSDPAGYYGVVEEAGWRSNDTEAPAYETWGDCWES